MIPRYHRAPRHGTALQFVARSVDEEGNTVEEAVVSHASLVALVTAHVATVHGKVMGTFVPEPVEVIRVNISRIEALNEAIRTNATFTNVRAALSALFERLP